MNQESKPLPCPFCGKELIQHSLYGTNWRHPETACEWCVVTGVITDLEKWNNRPTEDRLRSRVGELEEEHSFRDGIAAQREALMAEKDKEILDLHDELKEAKDDYWKAFNLSKGYSTL